MTARVVIFLILPGVAATLLADVFPFSAGIAALMAAIGALGHHRHGRHPITDESGAYLNMQDFVPPATARIRSRQ